MTKTETARAQVKAALVKDGKTADEAERILANFEKGKAPNRDLYKNAFNQKPAAGPERKAKTFADLVNAMGPGYRAED